MFTPENKRKFSARRVLPFLSILVILVLSGGLGLFAALAAFGPFQYGDGYFYTIQRWVETSTVTLDQRPGGKAQHLFDIAARRDRDFAAQVGSPTEQAALDEVALSVYQAVQAATQAKPEDAASLRPELLDLLKKVRANTASQKSAPFQAWLDNLLQRVENPNVPLDNLLEKQAPPPAEPSSAGLPVAVNQPAPTAAPTKPAITPHPVIFPPNSAGAKHDFYPLDGKHASSACTSCHPGGSYKGTPNQCADCHNQNTPANHYPGDCATCHIANSWNDTHFDHQANQAADCKACHQQNAPARHYTAQCSSCHSSNSWLPAQFSHAAARATNCQACHSNNRPADHFPNQCSLCHSTNAWKPADFRHSGNSAADCAECHEQNKPDDHFEGQCSACHETDGWKPAGFDHGAAQATDCQKCHANDKPDKHYDGQCSGCHDTNKWKPADFSHRAAQATDCQSCHANDKPAKHYKGQCSACHETKSWKPTGFDHAAAQATNCQGCHTSQKPAGHYNGQCSDCHTTSDWSSLNFKHTFPMKHGGARAECALCHVDSYKTWTCLNCHQKAKLEDAHEKIPEYASSCLACHPTGKLP